jgi:DNA repair protein RadC
VVLPSVSSKLFSETFETALGRLRGHRALLIGTETGDVAPRLRKRFEKIEIATTDSKTSYKYESDYFDLVAFLGSFHHLKERAAILTDVMRALKTRGRVMVVDGIPLAGNDRQQTHLMLRQMLSERDAAMGLPLFPLLTTDEIQRELKAASFHHLRAQEFLQTNDNPGGDNQLKEQALEILRMDVIPSLAHLGIRRQEFEKRLVEIKQRIERIGIESHPFAVVSGINKFRKDITQPNLFTGENTPTDIEKESVPYEIPREIETSHLSLEERLLNLGPASLRIPELLAFLISPAEPERALEFAERILSDYGSRAVSEEQNPHHLKEMLGIPLPTACKVVALFEIGRRFFQDVDIPILRNPEDVFKHVQEMAKLPKEHFRCLFLNVRGELVGDELIATGTRASARLHPREIFRQATQHNAVAFILCHNHPSGHSTPSPEDIELTRRLVQAGKAMSIELLDHIIVTYNQWTSFRDSRLL